MARVLQPHWTVSPRQSLRLPGLLWTAVILGSAGCSGAASDEAADTQAVKNGFVDAHPNTVRLVGRCGGRECGHGTAVALGPDIAAVLTAAHNIAEMMAEPRLTAVQVQFKGGAVINIVGRPTFEYHPSVGRLSDAIQALTTGESDISVLDVAVMKLPITPRARGASDLTLVEFARAPVYPPDPGAASPLSTQAAPQFIQALDDSRILNPPAPLATIQIGRTVSVDGIKVDGDTVADIRPGHVASRGTFSAELISAYYLETYNTATLPPEPWPKGYTPSYKSEPADSGGPVYDAPSFDDCGREVFGPMTLHAVTMGVNKASLLQSLVNYFFYLMPLPQRRATLNMDPLSRTTARAGYLVHGMYPGLYAYAWSKVGHAAARGEMYTFDEAAVATYFSRVDWQTVYDGVPVPEWVDGAVKRLAGN